MSKVSLPIDQEMELVAAAKADIKAFGALYDHYYPHIRRYFAVKLHDGATIDDLTAQTFEKAIQHINKFEWQGYPFSAWLYRIASNTIKDYFRSLKRSNMASLDEQVVDLPANEPSSQDMVQDDWQRKYLRKLLDDLKPEHRQIIYLKFFAGHTNKEIAEKLDLSETNVSSIVYRVVSKLRLDMQKEYFN